MKRLMVALLGLTFAFGVMAPAFAQEEKKVVEKKKKAPKKKKADKKVEEKK